MRRLALGAALAVALFGLAALGGVARPDSARSADPAPRTLTVVGSGSVLTVPDTAGFSFGVVTRAKTAAAALAANASAAGAVVEALKRAGVAAADLQTQQVSLQPRYDDNGAAIVGYDAQTSVAATLRSLAKAGAVVDAAVAAGADQVSGPTLTSAAREALYRQALAAAYADAKAKAGRARREGRCDGRPGDAARRVGRDPAAAARGRPRRRRESRSSSRGRRRSRRS